MVNRRSANIRIISSVVQGRIDRLSPASSHGIRISTGVNNSNGAGGGSLLSTNNWLVIPAGNSSSRWASISFIQTIVRENESTRQRFPAEVRSTGYSAVLRARLGSTTSYRVPCSVNLSSGQVSSIVLGWNSGNIGGCASTQITLSSRRTFADVTPAASLSIPGEEVKPSEVPSIQAFNGGAFSPVVNQNSAIQALINKGIIAGYQGGRIDPDRLVTREEFASMVSAANLYWKVPAGDRTLQFNDVPSNRWSYRAIALAVRTGFLSGYPEGIFKPTEPMPREQVMASLVGGLGLTGSLSALNPYTDANAVSAWARPAVAAAIQAGILVDNSRSLKPRDPITRGEVATLIYQALENQDNQQETPNNLAVFQDESTDPETANDPVTSIAPLTQEITLVHAETPESLDGVQINSLTSTIAVAAKANETSPEITNTIDIGQRYTYQQNADGTYRGVLSVISREERNAIVNSEEVQAYLGDWSPEAQALPRGIYQNLLQNRLLKESPIRYTKPTIQNILIHQVTIDLSDPDTILAIGLGGGASKETDANFTAEPFSRLVQRNSSAAVDATGRNLSAAVVATGTFYGSQRRELYGNTVSLGQYVRYQGWEAAIDGKRGTALIIGEGNRPTLISSADITANNLQELWQKPIQDAWFYLTAGPRLLKDGNFSFNPTAERLQGFANPDALAGRAAIGFSADKRTLYWVTPELNVSFRQLADIMQAIGCSEAMNLDGGGSRALAINGEIQVPAADLSHALVVYDVNRPAPSAIRNAWNQYQVGDRRPSVPPVAPPVAPPAPPPLAPTGNINTRIVQAMNTVGIFLSNANDPDEGAPPGGGKLACVWAVNKVLRAANVPPFSSNGVPIHYVPTVEDILKSGRGIVIASNQAQPGDLVIAPNQEHMGICYKPGIVRSNSSSGFKTANIPSFSWDTNLNFDGYYGSTPTRIYRLQN